MRFLRFGRTTTDDVQVDQWEWCIDETTLHFGDEHIRVLGVTIVREQRSLWMHSMFRRFVSLQPEPFVDRVSGTFADNALFVANAYCGSRRLTSIGSVPSDGFIRWVHGDKFELIARIAAVVGDSSLPLPPYAVASDKPDVR